MVAALSWGALVGTLVARHERPATVVQADGGMR